MFEIIGYGVLRLLGLRRRTDAEVFGSFYEREEGPLEFAVGLGVVMLVVVLAGVLDMN